MSNALRHRTAIDGSAADGVAITLPKRGEERDTVGVDDLHSLCTMQGPLLKRNNSVWMTFMPCCVSEKWKMRYFILAGSYLYRFSDEEATKQKGTPISITSATIRALNFDPALPDKWEDHDAFGPEPYCLELVLLRKKVVLQAANADECSAWVQALQKRRLVAIREGLGHAPLDPRMRALDKAAKQLNEKRLQREADEAQHMLKEGQNLINGMSMPGGGGFGSRSGGGGEDTFSPMSTRSSYGG